MEEAEIFSFQMVPKYGGRRQSFNNKILVGAKWLRLWLLQRFWGALQKDCLFKILFDVRKSYIEATIDHPPPSKHPQKTPPTWHPPPTIATSHHCPPRRFSHAEMTVKGTEVGYRPFSPAEISHWQSTQQANIHKTRWQRVMTFHS